jgi:hypothetical protein
MAGTLKEFRKQHPELKGKKIYLCEHLRDKSIDLVDINLFIGNNTRILLCPVCQKYVVGTALEYAAQLVQKVKELSKDVDNHKYQEWLLQAGKEK